MESSRGRHPDPCDGFAKFYGNSVELAVHLLSPYWVPGAIKDIQLKRNGCFKESGLMGEASTRTVGIQSWQSEMWAVLEAQAKCSGRRRERRFQSGWHQPYVERIT